MIVVPGMFWMPMTTISPSRTGRRVTVPSSGETISVLPRRSAARASWARAWVARRAAASAWAEAASAAAWSPSKSACGSRPWLRSSRPRTSALAASSARARAAAWSASTARTRAVAASRSLEAGTESIRATTCPLRTRSPSLTGSETSLPMTEEPTSA